MSTTIRFEPASALCRRRRPALTRLLAAAAAGALLALSAPPASAVRLAAAEIRFEINDTDGDAGIQIFFDGVGWRRMQVLTPRGRTIMDVIARRGVRRQGITEMFLESAEPSFEEQTLEELLERFPEGRYRFRGRTKEGRPLTGSATLTHDLPDAPVITRPTEGDDAVNPANTVIRWERVSNPPGSRIVGYQVIVTRDTRNERVFEAAVGRDATRLRIPSEFMESGRPYKVEVLSIERSGNQTISEMEFETR